MERVVAPMVQLTGRTALVVRISTAFTTPAELLPMELFTFRAAMATSTPLIQTAQPSGPIAQHSQALQMRASMLPAPLDQMARFTSPVRMAICMPSIPMELRNG